MSVGVWFTPFIFGGNLLFCENYGLGGWRFCEVALQRRLNVAHDRSPNPQKPMTFCPLEIARVP